MLPGVYQATKKDGSVYYRSNITYRNKHISLGSFSTEAKAHEAYCVANHYLCGRRLFDDVLEEYISGEHSSDDAKNDSVYTLSFEKMVSLFNFRDHGMYVSNPIYLRNNYFSYYLSPTEELKFDIDDLFYYSQHKILRRQGHLFVNDYGMQVTILSRYGLKNYAVCGRDYAFANGDKADLRYSNVVVINRYYGVTAYEKKGKTRYRVKIHINGNYTVGTYSTEEKAAIAYNKAVDLARKAGIDRNFNENYVDSLTPSEYADFYLKVKISEKYMQYIQDYKNRKG
ncbi:MAG: hypothetical protein ACI4F0_01245 [Agathobacter sp.]